MSVLLLRCYFLMSSPVFPFTPDDLALIWFPLFPFSLTEMPWRT